MSLAQRYNFSFKGITKDYLFVTSKSEIVLPPVKHNIISIPGRDGGFISETRLEMRKIDVNIEIDIPVGWTLEDVEEDLADYLFSEKEEELIFTTATDRTYYARIENTSLEPIGQLAAVGRLSFICPDGLKYGPLREIKLDAQTNKIYYAGTAPVIPEIEIIPKEKTTYAGYTNGEKSVLVGYPIDVETTPYERYTTVRNQVFNNTTGWTDATTMYGIKYPLQVSGRFSTTTTGVTPIDYGTTTSEIWHGPALEHVFSELLNDFSLYMYIGFDNPAINQLSLFEWHLLSADDEVLARLRFGDFHAGLRTINAELIMGTETHNRRLSFQDSRWNDFRGTVMIRREGNRIGFYVARTSPSPHYQIRQQDFIDTEGLFDKPVAKIKMGVFQFGNHNTTNIPRFMQMIVKRINPSKDDMTPYIANTNDVITIDKSLQPYINGQMTNLNVFSEPIELQKGENTLIALPPTADVTVRFREVFK